MTAAALVGLAAAALTACGGAGDGPSQTATQADPAAASVVTIGVPTEVTTVDPTLTTYEVDVLALGLTAGTLLEAVPGEEEPRPLLAESCAFDTRTEYRCTLKDDLRFSDGSPLRVTDVVASLERARTDEGNVNGGLFKPIRRIRAAGERDVVIELEHPYTVLPTVLTEIPFAIVPERGLREGKSFWRAPVGAGPYRITRNDGNEVTFERNDHFAGGRPAVEQVQFRSIKDPNTRLLQLRSGQLDIAHGLPATLNDQVTGEARPEVVRQFGALYLLLNNRRGPLADVRVRQAIASAVDRDMINAVAYGGGSKPLGSFLPSNMVGHDPEAPTARDLDHARELLSGTECEAGCTLSLQVREGFSPQQEVSVAVQQNLKDIGIDVELNHADQSVTSQRLQDGDFDMEVASLVDVVNQPDGIMLQFGLSADGGIEAMFTGYHSPEMEKAIGRVSRSTGAARDAALAEVNRIFAEDLPYVPLLDWAVLVGTRVDSDVMGLGTSGMYQVARASESAP